MLPERTEAFPSIPLTMLPDFGVTESRTPEARWFIPICPEAMLPDITMPLARTPCISPLVTLSPHLTINSCAIFSPL